MFTNCDLSGNHLCSNKITLLKHVRVKRKRSMWITNMCTTNKSALHASKKSLYCMHQKKKFILHAHSELSCYNNNNIVIFAYRCSYILEASFFFSGQVTYMTAMSWKKKDNDVTGRMDLDCCLVLNPWAVYILACMQWIPEQSCWISSFHSCQLHSQ